MIDVNIRGVLHGLPGSPNHEEAGPCQFVNLSSIGGPYRLFNLRV